MAIDITKVFTKNGTDFAVELNDNEHSYPVFLEALTGTNYFHKLLESGWKFYKLPYDFRKGSLKLSELPKEELDLSANAALEQDMWDCNGNPLSTNELMANITESPDLFLPIPETNYTIHTREEFLDYLTKSKTVSIDDDFLPINYFVHPNALFSYEEFVSDEYASYVALLSKRRTMSYTKFQKLVRWCLARGLSEDFKAIDLIDFYLQWGIDGLNARMTEKKRDTIRTSLGYSISMDTAQTLATRTSDTALINRNGERIDPPTIANASLWKPVAALEHIDLLCSSITDFGEYKPITIEAKAAFPVVKISMEKCELIAGYDTFLLRSLTGSGREKRLDAVSVRGVDSSSSSISLKYWNPKTVKDWTESMYLKAIAYDLLQRLTAKTDVSSYQALLTVGCSPKAALTRIVKKAELDVAPALKASRSKLDVPGEDDNSRAPEATIRDACKYLETYESDRETALTPEVIETIENIFNGTINIDRVSSGITADNRIDVTKYYEVLYTANKILGISVEDIYKQLNDITYENAPEYVKFGTDEKHVKLYLAKRSNRADGFRQDIKDYLAEMADECIEAYYVTQIAVELGSMEASKHVGVAMYTMRGRNGRPYDTDEQSQALFKECVDTFIDEVETNIAPKYHNAYKKSKNGIAYAMYFNLAINGSYTFPKSLGGRTLTVEPQKQQLMKRYLEEEIEDTISLCDTLVSDFDGSFRRYCVNATVTPEKVYPKEGYTIPSYSLMALWRSWSPEHRNILISKNKLPNPSGAKCTMDTTPWTVAFGNDKTMCSHSFAGTSLMTYLDKAEEQRLNFPNDIKFVAVKHPLYNKYPGLINEDEESANELSIDTPRVEAPRFDIVERKDVAHSEVEVGESAVSAYKGPIFKFFKGLSSTDFRFGKSVFDLPKKDDNNPIMIVGNTQFFINGETHKLTDIVNFTNMSSVIELTNRRYVVRDVEDTLWEVTI